MQVDIEKLKALTLEAGTLIKEAKLGSDQIISKEGHSNFVTSYDRKVQDFLERELARAYPDFQFVAEESDCNEKVTHKPCFIVDPIDGTSNFIHSLPFSAISLAALEGGEPIAGVVYNPFMDELYWAEKGKGSYFNGERLKCPDQPLALSLWCVGMSPYYAEYFPATFRLMAELMPKVTDLRRLGAAALDLCYIASGRQGGFCEWQLQPWDYAAGQLIAEEAGAVVSDIHGNKLGYNKGTSILAAGPRAYHEFQSRIDLEKILQG